MGDKYKRQYCRFFSQTRYKVFAFSHCTSPLPCVLVNKIYVWPNIGRSVYEQSTVKAFVPISTEVYNIKSVVRA